MGILDRFFGNRMEEQITERIESIQRLFEDTGLKNAPPTYQNDFITERAWFQDIPSNQAKMVRMNPWAWAVTTGLANSVFEDEFRFVDPKDPEKEIMQDVLKELKRMEIFKWCAIALGGERAHGHTWFFVGMEEITVDVITGPPRIANLDVFTPEYATVTEWDEIGRPKTLTLRIATPVAGEFIKKDIPTSECILVRTRPYDRSERGLPVTGPIWNSLVSTAILDNAITTYAAKTGVGALILKTKGAISTEDKIAAENTMIDLSQSRVGVIPGKVVESLEYIGASGSTVDFSIYTNIFKEEIAAGTKIPLSILTGAADVAAGVEVGPGEMANLKQGEQKRFEPVIREMVRRGWPNDKEYAIDWPVKTAIDRKGEAEIRALEAQADLMEGQAEIAKQGRGPNDIQISTQEEKPKDQDKNNNPAGVQ